MNIEESLMPPPCDSAKLCESSTIPDRLSQKKRRLEMELAETNEALKALEQNPEISRVLTLIGRAIGGRY